MPRNGENEEAPKCVRLISYKHEIRLSVFHACFRAALKVSSLPLHRRMHHFGRLMIIDCGNARLSTFVSTSSVGQVSFQRLSQEKKAGLLCWERQRLHWQVVEPLDHRRLRYLWVTFLRTFSWSWVISPNRALFSSVPFVGAIIGRVDRRNAHAVKAWRGGEKNWHPNRCCDKVLWNLKRGHWDSSVQSHACLMQGEKINFLGQRTVRFLLEDFSGVHRFSNFPVPPKMKKRNLTLLSPPYWGEVWGGKHSYDGNTVFTITQSPIYSFDFTAIYCLKVLHLYGFPALHSFIPSYSIGLPMNVLGFRTVQRTIKYLEFVCLNACQKFPKFSLIKELLWGWRISCWGRASKHNGRSPVRNSTGWI